MILSLVIPCYNEAKNIPLLADRLAACVTRSDVEIILVDNGSTDGSAAALSAAASRMSFVRTVRVEVNQGYGHGIVAGLKAARGTYIGWTHADLQTDPADALRGLALIEAEGAPETLFVKGARQRRPIGDWAFTAGMNVFETVLFGTALWEINAQPNLFPRRFFERWPDPPKDFSLDLFAYVMAKQHGLRIMRFPVKFGERLHGSSHWNIDWKAKMKFIRRTITYSVRLRRQAAFLK